MNLPWPIVRRVAVLLLTAVSLYLVFPSIAEVLDAWPALATLAPGWFALMVVVEAASFVSLWWLLRISLRFDDWGAIATSQLASNAWSRVVPGGVAAGGALQFQMLTRAGADGPVVATGLTVMSLLSTGTLFTLPVFVLPAILSGGALDPGLVRGAWLAFMALGVAAALAILFFTLDRPLHKVGTAVGWLTRREHVGDRMVDARNLIRAHLSSNWPRALVASLGKWILDYTALVAAVIAVRGDPPLSALLLAYVTASLLAMIPLTPGGIGFVEAGLTGMLALAGLSATDAVLATLAYRLVSYWIPLPAGAVAYALFERKLRRTRSPS